MSRLLSTICLLTLSLFQGAVFAAPQSHEFTSSDGVRLHYLTDGDQGSPVVLVHGFTSSAQGNWYNTGIAQELARNHRVIAIDMRNHGESEVLAERTPGNVRDVLELLDHLSLSKVHMHGYSMGGFTTLAVLAVAPERLITASVGGAGVLDHDANIAVDADFDWDAALAGSVPTTFPIDLKSVAIPVMAINGSDDSPYPKTARMTRELAEFVNVILPGYGHMNAMRAGTGYVEHLAFFLQHHDIN